MTTIDELQARIEREVTDRNKAWAEIQRLRAKLLLWRIGTIVILAVAIVNEVMR